jgi:protein-tyrosine phosphatase
MKEIFWLEKNRIGGRCGPAEVKWSLSEFRRNGIDSILSLHQNSCDPNDIVMAGFNHYVAPLPNTCPPTQNDENICKSLLPGALNFLSEELCKQHTVLIHCEAGKDRTCLIMAYYLAKTHGFSSVDAVSKVKQVKSTAFNSAGWNDMAIRTIDELTLSVNH